MKKTKKIIGLLMAFSMTMSLLMMPAKAEGIVNCDGVQFLQGENVISFFDENTDSISAKTTITNSSAEEKNPYIFLTVWNGDSLVHVDANTEKVSVGEVKDIKITLSEDYLLKSGDVIKAMVWEGANNMKPLCDTYELSEAVFTNNVIDYQTTENVTELGKWSYYITRYRDSLTSASSFDFSRLGTQMYDNGNWYLDSRDWICYVKPNGEIISEKELPIAYVYTIGEDMAGKELRIKTNLAGKDSTMLIAKTVDTDASNFVYGGNVQTIVWDQVANFDVDGYKNLNDGEYELVIPADEVKVGNDIIFLVQIDSWWDGTNCVDLDATIVASDDNTVYSTYAMADSKYDFTLNADETKWNYYCTTEMYYETDEYGDSVFTGINLNEPLVVGQAPTYEGKWTLNNADDRGIYWLDSERFASDGRRMSWVYELGDDFLYSEDGIKLNATINTDVVCSAELEIVKINGDGTAELLYDSKTDSSLESGTNTTYNLTLSLPRKEYFADTKIVFIVRQTTGYWWVSNNIAFSIYTATNTSDSEPQYYTSGRANSTEDFTTDADAATWEYYFTRGDMAIFNENGELTGVEFTAPLYPAPEDTYYAGSMCRDWNDPANTCFIKGKNFAGDWMPIAWVYTLGDDFANPEHGIRINANVVPDVVCRNMVRIVLINPDGSVKLLYNTTEYTSEPYNISLTLDKDEYEKGSKIAFISRQDGGYHWVAGNTADFTIATY